MNKISAKNVQDTNIFVCALRGLAAAVLSALIIAVLSCLVGLGLDDPDKYAKIFALISLFFASLIGGFSTAANKKSSTLLCGICTAIMIIAVITILSLAFSLSISLTLFGICAPCITVSCVLGANIGVGMTPRKKRRRK